MIRFSILTLISLLVITITAFVILQESETGVEGERGEEYDSGLVQVQQKPEE